MQHRENQWATNQLINPQKTIDYLSILAGCRKQQCDIIVCFVWISVRFGQKKSVMLKMGQKRVIDTSLQKEKYYKSTFSSAKIHNVADWYIPPSTMSTLLARRMDIVQKFYKNAAEKMKTGPKSLGGVELPFPHCTKTSLLRQKEIAKIKPTAKMHKNVFVNR